METTKIVLDPDTSILSGLSALHVAGYNKVIIDHNGLHEKIFILSDAVDQLDLSEAKFINRVDGYFGITFIGNEAHDTKQILFGVSKAKSESEEKFYLVISESDLKSIAGFEFVVKKPFEKDDEDYELQDPDVDQD